MDLNQKIEARRRELAAEEQKEQIRQNQEKAEIEARVEEQLRQRAKVEKSALDEAVARRLKDENIQIPESVSKAKVDAEVEALLTKAASDRMTPSENNTLFVLVILGIGSMFFAWWLAVIFLVISGVYWHTTIEKHKTEIAPSRTKEAVETTAGSSKEK